MKAGQSLPSRYSSDLKIGDIRTRLRRPFRTDGAVSGKGNFLGARLKAIYGDLEEPVELLGKSTAYVERAHLTMRAFSSRLTRKSIVFSKKIGMRKAGAVLEDMYYNLIRSVKTPRLKNENGLLLRWRQD